jgi:hypothetical protein
MHADVVVLILVLVLGCAAFIFGILYVIGRLIGGIGRGVISIFRSSRPGASAQRFNPCRKMRVCPRPECRKIENRDALYCSQCGARLTRRPTDGQP